MAYDGVLNAIRTCIAGGKPDRLPVFILGLEFDMVQNGLSCEQSRTDIEATVAATMRSLEHFGYDWAMVFPDDYIEIEPLGLEMVDDPHHPAMVASYLPMTPETLRGFRLPDPSCDLRLPIHMEMLRRVRAAAGDTACVTGRIAARFSALGLVYGIEAVRLQGALGHGHDRRIPPQDWAPAGGSRGAHPQRLRCRGGQACGRRVLRRSG
jgi:uroporphyrinogen-III decarboxylase